MAKTKKNIKHTTNKKSIKENKPKNTNNKQNKNTKTNSKNILTLKLLHNVVYKEYPKINMSPKVFNKNISDFESKELFQKQKDKYKYVKNLVSGEVNNYEIELFNFKSKKIHEYKPPADKQDDESCIKSKYDVTKMDDIGSGVFGNAFKIKTKDKKTYAIKVIDFTKLEFENFKEQWKDALTIENIENEATIAKEMGELNIGPKIHDVYYCIKNGLIKYYFVMDYMNQGSLEDYMKKNKLSKANIKQILNKLNKMHKIGILHNDLHDGNILVNKNNKGKLEFFISDFGLSKKLSILIKKTKQTETNSLETILTSGISLFEYKEKKIEHITKYILANYVIDN